MHRYHDLSSEKRHILLEKGTEAPFSGIDDEEEGVYLCAQCDYPLYFSHAKFSSRCGWPSFEEEIKGHIEKKVDQDGLRMEIVCARCRGHLGHVFFGEGFTQKNTRHCVNSLSMEFIPCYDEHDHEKAYFAGGCFWGVEALMKPLKGILSIRCGYMGGWVVNPTYEEVCTGLTGHAETIEVLFNQRILSYETLAKRFFEIHDPTELNYQGPDHGTQYRSCVFYASREQKRIAEALIQFLRNHSLDIATVLEPMSFFYPAEEYHQDYYKKNGKAPYCHTHTKRFF